MVEKKLLLLPNFGQLKHRRCKEPLSSRCLPCNLQYQAAFSRPFRCIFNPEPRICSFEYMLAFLVEKNSRRWIQPTCPPSCSNTRRSDYNMSILRMRNPRPFRPREQRVAAHRRSTGVIQNILQVNLEFRNTFFNLHLSSLLVWFLRSQLWEHPAHTVCNTFKSINVCMLLPRVVFIPFFVLTAHI